MLKKLSTLFNLVIGCSTLSAYDPGIHFPKETSLFFDFKNTEILTQISEDHPVKRLLNIPAIKSKLSGLMPDDAYKKKLESELGLEAGGYAQIATQNIALGCQFKLDTISIPTEVSLKTGSAGFTAVLGIDDDAFMDEFIKNTNLFLIAESKLSTESLGTVLKSIFTDNEDFDSEIFSDRIEDIPLYMVNILTKETDELPSMKIPLGFGLINNQLMAGMHPEGDYFRECVRKIKKEDGDTESLASTKYYMDSQDALNDSDVFAYCDFGNITYNLNRIIEKFYDTRVQKAGEQGAIMSTIAPKKNLIDFLGLHNFSKFTASAKFEESQLKILSDLRYNSREGILAKLLNFDPSQNLHFPDFSTHGVTSIVMFAYDLASLYERTKSSVSQISPMIDQIFTAKSESLAIGGSTLPKLFPMLGKRIYQISFKPQDAPSSEDLAESVWMVELSDATGLTHILSEMETVGESTHGATIKKFDMGKQTTHLSVKNDTLLIADSLQTIRFALTSMQQGGDLMRHAEIGRQWKLDGFKNLVGFEYYDFASFIGNMSATKEKSQC